MEQIAVHKCFGGQQKIYTHASEKCQCHMTFGIYLPSIAAQKPVPVLWFLAGLTCTHENAMIKAGAQGFAAKHGIALVFPDTSPRGAGVADDEAFDLGQGAGFYVNATQAPWYPHFQMFDYITQELPALIAQHFPVNPQCQSITGHSMGGHGALTLAMLCPDQYRSLSAFAPICNPTVSEWGRKQFSAYLGADEMAWRQHDASLLMAQRGYDKPILVDTGADDPYLELLRSETLAASMAQHGLDAQFRMHKGYEHSYFFVTSFLEEHIAFHAQALEAATASC